MHVAAQAVGQHWLGDTRAAVAGFLLGLLLTFLFVRINTRLIRAKVSWWFHDIESEGGTHVHHMVFGVITMAGIGFVIIAAQPTGLLAQVLAFIFGAGVALTLDEFALILHLQDVYWTTEGRVSVDAVIVVVCVAGLIVMGVNPFRDIGKSGTSGDATRIAIAVIVSFNLLPALLCLLKGKLWTGLLGLFVPIVGIVGAVRLARPNSPWAHRRYADRPKRLARAERRQRRINAHVDAWRDVFFDLIAGKPHLPSLPGPDVVAPKGANGGGADVTAGGGADDGGEARGVGATGDEAHHDAGSGSPPDA